MWMVIALAAAATVIISWNSFRPATGKRWFDWLILMAAFCVPIAAGLALNKTIGRPGLPLDERAAKLAAQTAIALVWIQLAILALLFGRSFRGDRWATFLVGLGCVLNALLTATVVFGTLDY